MLALHRERPVQAPLCGILKGCDSNRRALRFKSQFWARFVAILIAFRGLQQWDRQRQRNVHGNLFWTDLRWTEQCDPNRARSAVRLKSHAGGGAIQIARGRRCRDSNRERAAGSRFKSRAGGGAIQIPSGPIFNVFLTSFIAQQTAHCQNAGSRTINVLSAVAFQQWARFICARLTCTNRKPSLNRHCAAIGDSLPTNWHSVAKRNIVPF